MSAALARARRAETRWQPSLADRLRQSREDRKLRGRMKEQKPPAPIPVPVQQRYLLQPMIQVNTGIFNQTTTAGAFISGFEQEFDTFGRQRLRFTVTSNTTDVNTITTAVNRYAGLPLNNITIQNMKVETANAWRIWHDTGTTACNTCVVNVNTEWQGWVTTPVRTHANTWEQWYDTSIEDARAGVIRVRAQTPRFQVGESNEQRRLREQQEETCRKEEAARQAKWKEEEAQRKAADEKAMKLLISCLNPEQQKDLKTNGCFYVKAKSGRMYRIDQGTHGNVKVVHPTTKVRLESLCIQPAGVPAGDAMLAQKLMIEACEEQFRKYANITVYGAKAGEEKYISGVGGLLDGSKLAEVIPLRRAA